MPNGKLKIEHRITKLETAQEEFKQDLKEVKECVNNHIPTLINAQGEKYNNAINQIHNKLDSQKNWLISLLASTILLLLGVIINFFK